ncbi:type II secretion system secretin GspD [Sideroxydans lithotrophicus]|uniref:General secretion pathway protein D n=1 Tax=Sideroxydans lithotrophicus (strain ES-1) TaxID=580332 RepID=D5CMQ3_SIDLE|nr:type II secretion system secretin GspD [Sideroxydans lithotrophicus]ADE10739.1 general secretion pathway protein D [Sideroxydans lithotrophicus ES-1]
MINSIALRSLLIFSLAIFVAAPCHAEKKEDELVTLNFVNADIQEVIRAISQISKKNFLVDPRVKGTINIVSATPVSPALGYDILLSALRLQGYAAVESNGVTQIIPEAEAKQHIDSLAQGRGDKLVTHVFVLKYESASQLVNVVRPMISPNSVVVAYPASNALVVTDYASSVRRIDKLIDSIDQPSADAPIVIPVKHASAVDLANIINRLMPEAAASQSGGDDNQRFVLLADSRTNGLLLRSGNPGRIARVKELVTKLDSAANTPGNIHVVQLKNADATKLAQTLRSVLSGETAPPAAPSTVPQSAGVATSSTGMIQADPSSNALIVTASEPIYNNLRSVIDKLDVRRPQIFVEALIVEVTADKAAEFGVQWQNLVGASKSGAHIIGGTNFGSVASGNNIIDAANNLSTVNQGLNIGIVNGTTTIPGVGTVLNLGMLARALETDTNANILSEPNLMTLDNEEAKIVVGQNVPFITGQYAQTGSATTATPFQTIERKDVGLTLKIKPQIMQGGTVKLQIYQEVSSVLPSSSSSTSGLITNKRSIESNILVDDNQIVVLGGLIQDSVNDVQSKTPLLGDIPILGSLFRYDTRQHTKTNLMVFIRPYIMYQQNSYQQLTDNFYEQMNKKREDARMPDHWILPNDDKDKSLPPLPEKPVSAASSTEAASAPAAAPTQSASAPVAASPPDRLPQP